MFQEIDPVLGPEMHSTGEVLGVAHSYGEAFYKSQEAIHSKLPLEGTLLISVNLQDKSEVAKIAKSFVDNSFQIIATGITYAISREAGIPAKKVKNLYEGRPNILDWITNEKIQLIITSPIGKESIHDDSYLRKAAVKFKIPYITTISAAKATAESIHYMKTHTQGDLKSLQEWHREIREKS